MESNRILELLWNRTESAIDELRNLCGPRLYQTAYHILGSHPDAEEAVNDTYLAVWERIPPERPNSLEGFVYRIGRNLALKKLRYISAQKRSDGYDLSLDELAEALPGDSLEAQIDARELGRSINRFLSTLSQENRDLFLRRYWFGDSITELSQAVGMTKNALTVRLSRLRTGLKQHLIQEGSFYET